MHIGLDLDGTTHAFTEGFLAFYNKQHGTAFTPDQITRYEWEECLPIRKEVFRSTLKEFDKSNGWATLNLLPEVEEDLRWACTAGHVFTIVTMREEVGVAAALKHFKDLGLPITHAVKVHGHDKNRKAGHCSRLALDMMLEDHIEYAVEIAEHSGVAVALMTQPYNKHYWEMPRFPRLGLPIWPVDSIREAIELGPEWIAKLAEQSDEHYCGRPLIEDLD